MTATHQPDRIGAIATAVLALALNLLALPANADLPTALLNMESGDNPLIQISTTRGDIFVELFPRAAPRNVQRFLDLAEGRIELTHPESGEPVSSNHYDGLPVHRLVRNHFVQAGEQLYSTRTAAEDAALINTVPHEINAQRLGLHEQVLMDSAGAPHPWLNISNQQDFQHKILVPLYRQMGITNGNSLYQQQDSVMQRLQQMNLQQAYELMGYRYDSSLSSRMPLAGSLMMVPRGPEGNSAEFFITLLDAPWLMGKNTVIGQIVTGLETLQEINQAGAGNTTIRQIRQVNRQL